MSWGGGWNEQGKGGWNWVELGARFSDTRIKSIALKTNMNINLTSRFINRKTLMFAKLLLKSFVYDMIDVFCLPNEEVKMICNKYDIIKCHMYCNLTNTNSCLCFFNFICKKECNIKESESRNLILQILK